MKKRAEKKKILFEIIEGGEDKPERIGRDEKQPPMLTLKIEDNDD